jgi:hypothetical protein
VDFGEKVKVRELYVTGSLYDSVTVTFATESSGEEGFAFGVNVECIDHGAQDSTVITLIVLEGFVCGDFLVVCSVEEVIIESASVI